MAKFKHLTKDRFSNACHRLFDIQSGLNGLGSLFEFQSQHSCISPDEFFGIGKLIKRLAEDLSIQEEILRCGYDSSAVTKEPLGNIKDESK